MHGLAGYYTLQEVCELTTLSEWTIRRMESKRRFPKRKKMSMRRVGFLKADVHRWLVLRDKWQPPSDDGEESDE